MVDVTMVDNGCYLVYLRRVRQEIIMLLPRLGDTMFIPVMEYKEGETYCLEFKSFKIVDYSQIFDMKCSE